ncbi:DUF1275 family protein [Pseudobutyrivibrio ruminis]|uniref:Uncharacterized protein n=1 Tax=Pseudobutyrivibrio ruminis TaxID=46206 RepID=A0A2G3DU21_9FIRM|nr:DUF1275 family protein [Pseudobutyrivibrio ruminis]PHU34375.1 hypothetical protein CSX01_10290 [Pseudobutyrivibrio ruminis]
MMDNIDSVTKILVGLLPILIAGESLYFGILEAMKSLQIELLLDEYKKYNKKLKNTAVLVVIIYAICGAVYNYLFTIEINVPEVRSVAIWGLIISIIIDFIIVFVGHKKGKNVSKIHFFLIIFMVFILGALISSLLSGYAYHSLFALIVIPLVEGMIACFVYIILQESKASKVSEFKILLDNEEFYIHIRIGDDLLCGSGITLEQSDRLRLIKRSKIRDENIVINYINNES